MQLGAFLALQPQSSLALGLLSAGKYKSWSHSNPCHSSGHLQPCDPGLDWKEGITQEGFQRNFTCPATTHQHGHKASHSLLHPLLLLIPPWNSHSALPHPQFSTHVKKEPSEKIRFNKSTLCRAKKSSDEKRKEKQNLTVAVFHSRVGPLGSFYC